MQTQEADARRRIVYELHAQGVPHFDIAKEIDKRFRHSLPRKYTSGDVANDLHAESAVVENLEGLSREQRKTLMAHRFQEIIASMRPAMLDGDTRAARIILQVMDREAALFGLDEPKKTISMDFDLRAEVEEYARKHNLNDDEKAALLSEAEDIIQEKQQKAGII